MLPTVKAGTLRHFLQEHSLVLVSWVIWSSQLLQRNRFEKVCTESQWHFLLHSMYV